MGRYFVAVYPPAPVLDEIEAIPRPEVDGVRWTRRDQWHVTLAFLGDVDEARVVDALSAVEHQTVEVEIGPAVRRLRKDVVVIPAAGLDGLAEAVVVALDPLVDGLGDRRFRGHLTLARARSGAPGRVVGQPIETRFDADEFRLVSSRLDHEGAAHSVVARFPLGEAGEGGSGG